MSLARGLEEVLSRFCSLCGFMVEKVHVKGKKVRFQNARTLMVTSLSLGQSSKLDDIRPNSELKGEIDENQGKMGARFLSSQWVKGQINNKGAKIELQEMDDAHTQFST